MENDVFKQRSEQIKEHRVRKWICDSGRAHVMTCIDRALIFKILDKTVLKICWKDEFGRKMLITGTELWDQVWNLQLKRRVGQLKSTSLVFWGKPRMLINYSDAEHSEQTGKHSQWRDCLWRMLGQVTTVPAVVAQAVEGWAKVTSYNLGKWTRQLIKNALCTQELSEPWVKCTEGWMVALNDLCGHFMPSLKKVEWRGRRNDYSLVGGGWDVE